MDWAQAGPPAIISNDAKDKPISLASVQTQRKSSASVVSIGVAKDLRQAYMKLLLDRVTVDRHQVRLEGSPAVLEKLANHGLPNSSPEVLSFVQEWRAAVDSHRAAKSSADSRRARASVSASGQTLK